MSQYIFISLLISTSYFRRIFIVCVVLFVWQPLQNLKWVDLSYSKNLKKLPDLSTATNLVSLDLSHCSGLMEVPSSIGNATNLLVLNIEYCSSLVTIPTSLGNIPNLKIFLAERSSLVQLPSCIWNITSLNTFNLSQATLNVVEWQEFPGFGSQWMLKSNEAPLYC